MMQSQKFVVPRDIAPSFDFTRTYQPSQETVERPIPAVRDADETFLAVARTLHRGRLNHVALTAERGVDPEAFVAEFARRAVTKQLAYLENRRVVLVDARHTVVDESRDRLLAILASLAASPEVIAFISGFATLLRTPQGTNRDVLLSALGSTECQIVGITLPNEYEELIAGDVDLEEVFHRVELPEPSLETAVETIRHYAATLSERYQIAISDEIPPVVATLSANYILNERLPGKARKILQRICQDIDFDRTQLGQARSAMTIDDVVAAVARASGVAEETLRGIAEKRDYERSLREFIIGQDHAVKQVATELGLIKAGLVDAGKPASVMMFVGQTGTGKTEMAKALSRFYSNSKRLRTYTLGNMVEPHSVSAIIGVPPGYVGHDRGGKIVQDLNADPHCVFLLDEADKAHPDVLQPFLNLFDEGWVRDQRGVQGYASKAIFILTTNVGQRMIADMAKQGKTPEEMAVRMKETLAQIKHGKSNRPVFAPEFLARIKRIIVFQPLSKEAMHGICEKLIREMSDYWREQRGKELRVSRAIVASIGAEAHRLNEKSDGREGGRIVRKLLSDYVDANLQRAISDQPQEYTSCRVVSLEAETSTVERHESSNGDETEREPARPSAHVIRVAFAK